MPKKTKQTLEIDAGCVYMNSGKRHRDLKQRGWTELVQIKKVKIYTADVLLRVYVFFFLNDMTFFFFSLLFPAFFFYF